MLIFQLKDHQVFISSMHDLLDRVDEKISTLEFYHTKLSESWDTAKRQSNEYNYENNKIKLELEFNKNFSSIKEDFALLTNLTKEVVELIQEMHIIKKWQEENKEEIHTLDKSSIGVSVTEQDDLPRFAGKLRVDDEEDKTENVNLLGLSTNNFAVRNNHKLMYFNPICTAVC